MEACTAESLWRLMDLEEVENIQHVTLRLGPIGKFDEGKLEIAALRDGQVVKTQTLVYKCVNGEAVFDERANAGAAYLFIMFFESGDKTLTAAADGSLVVKSFWSGRGLILLFPIHDESAKLFRFERLADAPVQPLPTNLLTPEKP